MIKRARIDYGMIFICDYAFAGMKKNWQKIFNENPFFINANLVFIKTREA